MKKFVEEYLSEYLSKSKIPFHTPGHKGRWQAPVFSKLPIYERADIPDDVTGFPGAIRASETEASRVYRTERSFYLVNGSTAGVHAMFLSCLKPDDRVILGRNLHQSAISALIKTGTLPVFIPTKIHERGVPLNVTPEDLREVLKTASDAKAVYITTPSYFGVCADISEIADICSEYGLLLLVDEAWGAHFPFSDGLPPSAVYQGADLVVHGVHKTMPTLTGTSLLHLCSDRVDPHKIKEALTLVETSSPNLLYYLSIESAIANMKTEGGKLLAKTIDKVKRIREEISRKASMFTPGFMNGDGEEHCSECAPDGGFCYDPLKLLVKTNYHKTGITGYDLSDYLTQKFGIIAEMAEPRFVLFIFTGFEEDGAADKLIEGLIDASCFFGNNATPPDDEISGEALIYPPIPDLVLTPRAAWFADRNRILLEDSEGRVSKSLVVPYPPGVPSIIPGEIITADLIEYHKNLINMGGVIRGLICDDDNWYIDTAVH